ncbi:MAG: WYL domain-containing protein [Clostridiales bacterium]|nr:WYL domain-containing protein [Clostridiales bacterium]
MGREKMINQKLKLLYIRDYLHDNSDEEHPVSVAKLISYLESNNIFVERKTIYDDIAKLRLYGEDIELRRGKYGGYFCASRDFDLPEIKMLVDSVQVSKFITEKQSMDLIKKLEHLANKFDADKLHRQVVVQNRVKTGQTNIFSNIDHISHAINTDCTVRFKYFYYNLQKKIEYRNNENFYEISPFCLLWDNEHYYMLGFDADAGKMKHYRVDRMKSVSATDNQRRGKEEFAKIDISSYQKRVFNMYHGEEKTVEIRFSKGLINVVLDRFGKDTMIIPEKDGEHFMICVKVDVSDQFYSWLLGFPGECEVISPKEIRDDLRNIGETIVKQYQ